MALLVLHALGRPELFTLFVDRIVRQVHEQVVVGALVTRLRERDEGLRRESDETLFIKEDLERLAAEHEDIKAQVEFEAVQEVWILHVLLHYTRHPFFLRDRIEIVRKKDTFSLAAHVWLHDHREVSPTQNRLGRVRHF